MTVIVQARAILDGCDLGTPRDLVAWAAGALTLCHAVHLTRIPLDPRHISNASGSWVPGHRGTSVDDLGVQVWDDKDNPANLGTVTAVPRISWARIAALVTLDRVGVQLHQRILAAVAARGEHDGVWDRPDQHGLAAWRDIEDECREVAALAWQRCRPDTDLQTDLFDLIGQR